MKRFAHSELFDSFIISSNEQASSTGNGGGYSKEFQAMLDSLEEEDNREDGGGGSAERKRRLRVDQVKGLERHFEVENKLEAERKMKIAAELELEPRQVTIWFQNRRARWKTKQLEKDYGVLKLNYDALKLDYDVVKKQNDSLASKVRELREKVRRDGDSCGKDYEFRNVINEEDQSLFNTEEPCDFCSVDQPPSLHWL